MVTVTGRGVDPSSNSIIYRNDFIGYDFRIILPGPLKVFFSWVNDDMVIQISWESKGPNPPMPPPPDNKALFEGYLPSLSLNNPRIRPYFLQETWHWGGGACS